MVRLNPWVWRLIGFVAGLVGFICYGVSSPFNKLFNYGYLGFFVVVIYCAGGAFVCCLMLCTTTWCITNKTVSKALVLFVVLMVTSVYSYFLDETEGNTKEKVGSKVLNLVSCGAFSLMSLSLSRLTGLGFESGVFSFFLASFVVAVMKLNWKFVFAAAPFCFILVMIHTCTDSQRKTGDIQEARTALLTGNRPMEGSELEEEEAGTTPLMANGSIESSALEEEARTAPLMGNRPMEGFELEEEEAGTAPPIGNGSMESSQPEEAGSDAVPFINRAEIMMLMQPFIDRKKQTKLNGRKSPLSYGYDLSSRNSYLSDIEEFLKFREKYPTSFYNCMRSGKNRFAKEKKHSAPVRILDRIRYVNL
ncbi:exocyst complex component EXO70B [Spatholobus suberectus]|nr:exocyst complex component EXO70B [Spatholobus suberectus]